MSLNCSTKNATSIQRLAKSELRLLLLSLTLAIGIGIETLTITNTACAANQTKSATPAKANRAKAAKPVRLKIEVPCRAWVPKNVQPKVVLLCVHGLGLNSQSYEDFGQQMQKLGVGTFAVDVRGFGTWIKLKGKDKCDFKSCLDDVEKALKVLHTAYPGKPIFILGESMGGAIALHVAAEHQDLVAGLISSVPSGNRYHKAKNKVRVALHLAMLRGNEPLDVGTKVIEEATEDEAMRLKWEADPYDRLKLSSKELIQFQRFMDSNQEAAERIDKIPVLFLVGLSDKLVKPKGTVQLYNKITATDKQLVTIRSSEHLIFELHQVSPELQKVLLGWLANHSKVAEKGKQL
jgi:acylglycerol lipase